MSYQRLVNTTPKPSATKNSNGELVAPPPLLCCCVEVGDGVTVADDDVVAVGEVIAAAPVDCTPLDSGKLADPHPRRPPRDIIAGRSHTNGQGAVMVAQAVDMIPKRGFRQCV